MEFKGKTISKQIRDALEGARTNPVQAKIRITQPVKAQIIIRKIEIDERDNFVAKYGLSQTGEWVIVPEGQRYPDECLFEAEATYEPLALSGVDAFVAFDDIQIVATVLDQAERQGADEDKPEGTRFVTFSDTLLKQLSSRLWALIWPQGR